MSEVKASIYERINRVKNDVERVPKTGKNQHFGYKFATESDIADILRKLMAEHGVCLVYHGPDPDRFKMAQDGTTKSGAPKYRYQVWCRYSVVNAHDSSDKFEVWGYGEALDQEDKGHNKAITNAHKYVHIKLFDISTGDLAVDPDSSSHMDQDAPPPQRATPPRSAVAATPGKDAFKTVVEKWSGVKREDLLAACIEVAKRNGKPDIKKITDDGFKALATYVEGQIKESITWDQFIKAGGVQ